MNYIGNKEKLRRANQKIVHLKRKLKKKDTVINEAISYIENTFELEDEKCITELYNILKKESEQ